MSFIEFEKSVKYKEWSMNELHSHSHYEIYFLIKGERMFFLSNALYRLNGGALVVIPPFVMHKTEGGPFERFNINVSPDYLDAFQKETLDNTAKRTAVSVPENKMAELQKVFGLIETADEKQKHFDSVRKAVFGYLVLLISRLNANGVCGEKATGSEAVPDVVLKTIDFLSRNYGGKITLEELCENFYTSKALLCKKFKQATNCTIIDFLLNIRLNKAKEYLTNSKKSVTEIAERCGFCSQNYFGLIFKQKVGLSPANYRKHQREKK